MTGHICADVWEKQVAVRDGNDLLLVDPGSNAKSAAHLRKVLVSLKLSLNCLFTTYLLCFLTPNNKHWEHLM